MAYNTVARLGGIGGILFVVLFFRSYLTPPDAPMPTSRPQDVVGYFTDKTAYCSTTGYCSSSPPSPSSGSSGRSTACFEAPRPEEGGSRPWRWRGGWCS